MTRAVVLINLGTPTAPTRPAVRRFLREFLSDPRVVDLPRLLWLPVLYGAVLPFRPRRVAAAYEQLWLSWGDSPLRLIARRQQAALQDRYDRQRQPVRVELAMAYGEPRLTQVLARLQQQGVRHVVLLPLYPQFSATTTGAIADQLAAFTVRQRDFPGISLIKDYHDHPLYIEALAESVEAHWRQHGQGSRLLLSFHGIPRRNIERGDPYQRQCLATAERLAARLQLAADQWSISFQSRLGRAEWLRPYTSEILQRWGTEGTASVDILCPAFSADCLETLEEIDIENRHVFERAGGGEYRYISCLNDLPSHIDLMQSLVDQYSLAADCGKPELSLVE